MTASNSSACLPREHATTAPTLRPVDPVDPVDPAAEPLADDQSTTDGGSTTDHGADTDGDDDPDNEPRSQVPPTDEERSSVPYLTAPTGPGPRTPDAPANVAHRRRKPWLPPDFEGTIFGERYRMGELLGLGGMALVYKAEHIQIQKPVAVKVLQPRFAGDPGSARRFLEEARAASKLRHENIIDITDFGRTRDGYVYFVLEYLDGEDLEQTAREDGPLPWVRVIAMAKQICKALALAHEKGVIHRDIKPANVFRVTRDNNQDFIKVLDFGIATSTMESIDPDSGDRRRDPTTRRLGTPAYMAPELLEGAPYDHRVDIYALGVLMYRLLAGELPGRSRKTHRDLRKNKPKPRREPIDIPGPLEAVIIRAMAHDAERRFQTAQEFYDALEVVETELTAAARLVTSMLGRDPLTWSGERDPSVSLGDTARWFGYGTVPTAPQPVAAETPENVIVVETSGAASGDQGLRRVLPMLLLGGLIAVLGLLVLRTVLDRSPDSDARLAQAPAGVAAPVVDPLSVTTGARPYRATESSSSALPPEAVAPTAGSSTGDGATALESETDGARLAVADSTEPEPEADTAEPAPARPRRNARARGQLSRRAFERTIRGVNAKVKSCQDRFSGGFPVDLDVVVDVRPTGKVATVKVKGDLTRLKKCVSREIKALTFPESARGGRHKRTFKAH